MEIHFAKGRGSIMGYNFVVHTNGEVSLLPENMEISSGKDDVPLYVPYKKTVSMQELENVGNLQVKRGKKKLEIMDGKTKLAEAMIPE